MIKKRYISAIFLTSVISLMGTGFSSWVIYVEPESAETQGGIYVADVEGFITGLNYVNNSTYSFDYYLYDGIYTITSSIIGFQLLMYKNAFYAALPSSNEDLYLHIALSYTSTTEFDIFTQSTLIESPTFIRAEHSKIEKYFINSEEISYYSGRNSDGINSYYTYVAATKILAYSPNKPSLYSLSDTYANDSDNQSYINMKYIFNQIENSGLNTTSNFEKFKSLKFKFSFNVNTGV